MKVNVFIVKNNNLPGFGNKACIFDGINLFVKFFQKYYNGNVINKRFFPRLNRIWGNRCKQMIPTLTPKWNNELTELKIVRINPVT